MGVMLWTKPSTSSTVSRISSGSGDEPTSVTSCSELSAASILKVAPAPCHAFWASSSGSFLVVDGFCWGIGVDDFDAVEDLRGGLLERCGLRERRRGGLLERRLLGDLLLDLLWRRLGDRSRLRERRLEDSLLCEELFWPDLLSEVSSMDQAYASSEEAASSITMISSPGASCIG